MTKRKKRKLIKRIVLWIIGLNIIFVVSSNVIIERYSAKYVHNDLKDLSHNKVGLVLGTSRRVASGRANYFFNYRIEAAVRLFNAGKIDYILVSGDNGTKEYNEPRDMQRALLDAGIPENRIVLDYAGFRTLDSIIRCRDVFGQENFTIITQQFHNERAVFLAHANGIKAYGYNATDVSRKATMKTRVREIFARTKVFIDLVIEKQPKFLGEKIVIGE